MLGFASALGPSGPRGAGRGKARASRQASWNRSPPDRRPFALNPLLSVPAPGERGCDSARGRGQALSYVQKEGCLQTSGRAQAISPEPEEGRVQAAGACAGGAPPPNSGGAFALDPILSTIKVAVRVLLSITLLLELYRRSLASLQPPPPLAMDPNCSCASGKGGLLTGLYNLVSGRARQAFWFFPQ